MFRAHVIITESESCGVCYKCNLRALCELVRVYVCVRERLWASGCDTAVAEGNISHECTPRKGNIRARAIENDSHRKRLWLNWVTAPIKCPVI